MVSVSEDEQRLLRHCLIATADIQNNRPLDPKVGLFFRERVAELQKFKLESLAFMALEEFREFQLLYDRIQDEQLRFAGPVLREFADSGPALLTQGLGKRHLFHGHCFGRRADLDIVLPRGTVATFREICERHGFAEQTVTMDIEFAPVTEQAKKEALRRTSFEKVYALARNVKFDVDADTQEALPDHFYPLVKKGGDVLLIINIEPTLSYSPVDNFEAINPHTVPSPEGNIPDQPAGMMISALRFLRVIRVGQRGFKPKMLCEIAAMLAYEKTDWEKIDHLSRVFDLPAGAVLIRYVNALIDPNAEMPQDLSSLPPGVVDIFGTAALESQNLN